MTIKVKSSFIVLQMYFNSLTLCLFWKKIDTNAPIHSNNQKSWFYSFFWERDVVYCMYPLPHPKTSLNQVNSYWKLLLPLKLLVEKTKSLPYAQNEFFSPQPQMTIVSTSKPSQRKLVLRAKFSFEYCNRLLSYQKCPFIYPLRIPMAKLFHYG